MKSKSYSVAGCFSAMLACLVILVEKVLFPLIQWIAKTLWAALVWFVSIFKTEPT